jgi:heme exporter protein A
MTTPLNPHIFLAQQLVISRGTKPVTPPLSFSINPHSSCLIQGPNGSGKTSVLLALAAFLPLSSGTLAFHSDILSFSRKISTLHEEKIDSLILHGFHSLIAFLPAETPFQPHLSPLEDLSLWHALALHEHSHHIHQPLASSPLEALEILKIDTLKHKKTSELSSGQKQRLALARLLLKPAQLWLLDEPFHHLDNHGTSILLSLFSLFIKNKGTLIYTDPLTGPRPSNASTHHHVISLPPPSS